MTRYWCKRPYFKNKPYGALSWYFAQALQGLADGNGDRQLSRFELLDYLHQKVRNKMAHTQTPKLLPRGDITPVLALSGAQSTPTVTANAIPEIPIRIEGGTLPRAVRHAKIVTEGYELNFVIQGQTVTVLNTLNDQLSEIAHRRASWQGVIDRQRWSHVLDGLYTPRLRPVKFSLRAIDATTQKARPAAATHRAGDRLTFTLQSQGAVKLPAPTLFNLTGTGQVQPLYPLQAYGDTLSVDYPYALPEFEVKPPYGGDTLVAILCTQPPAELQQLLNGHGVPTPETLPTLLKGQTCQVGRHAFFTTAKEDHKP